MIPQGDRFGRPHDTAAPAMAATARQTPRRYNDGFTHPSLQP
ncbi:hypothetical protein HMPREF0551_1621 [Lautropia mirabilis ATCC 51599]|uniref:Uncharacterized protein n=1 Tax=Lautropia mirabilis ATCC 51599 TaxID=887898 RepID=E7RY57_9BURK|nr:hypothetical protein HMPREF0551_1621 [Lautropia mirabilis ATCC 51599]